MSQKIGEYPFTLLALLFHENREVIACTKHSRLLEQVEITEFLSISSSAVPKIVGVTSGNS